MLTPVFRRISPTEKRADGYHYLTGNWMGRPMPVFEGQNLGTVIGGEGEGEGLPLTLQAFHDNGEPLTKGTKATLPPGKSLTYDFGLQPAHLHSLGRITIRVTPDHDAAAAVAAVAQTYPGLWGLFGEGVLNPLPTPSEIDAVAAQTGHTLCDDHRHFLETRNGIDWTWWQNPEWNTGRRSEGMDFFRALNEAVAKIPDIGVLEDTSSLFGAGDAHPYLSYPENLADMGFYDAAFLRFGLPVGVDGGGNLFVQILDGSRRGEVVFLDHEYHYGMLDDASPPQLAPDMREGAPDKPLETFTADEFWDHMFAVDYALPAAPSLSAMIETLTIHHTALMDALAADWRHA